MKHQFNILIALTLLATMALQSCKDDDIIVEPSYTVPTSYSEFTNVSYDGQTQRLSQFLEIKNYMKTATTTGTELDQTKLLAMFENDSENAGFTGTYEDSKQIKSKTFSNVASDFTTLFQNVAASSKSDVAHTEGTAGVMMSNDNEKQYLLNAKGVDEAQIIEKSLMGAFIAYQINEVYTSEDKMDVDNEIVTEGEGTDMEHHWDEAFGYFGVPTDFPASTENILFWGSYSNQRNDLLNSNEAIMNAFIAGRAAISNKNLENRDASITTLRAELEKVAVGSALHYINSSIANFDDLSLKGHALSEGIGFVYSLQFNGDKIITSTELSEILTLMGGSDDITDLDLYSVTTADLESAKTKLSAIYSMDSLKDLF